MGEQEPHHMSSMREEDASQGTGALALLTLWL